MFEGQRSAAAAAAEAADDMDIEVCRYISPRPPRGSIMPQAWLTFSLTVSALIPLDPGMYTGRPAAGAGLSPIIGMCVLLDLTTPSKSCRLCPDTILTPQSALCRISVRARRGSGGMMQLRPPWRARTRRERRRTAGTCSRRMRATRTTGRGARRPRSRRTRRIPGRHRTGAATAAALELEVMLLATRGMGSSVKHLSSGECLD